MLKGQTVFAIAIALTLLLSSVGFTSNYAHAQESPISTEVPNGFVRIGVVGDIDCNSGQTKQFDVMKKYNAQYIFSGGDYAYSDGQCVLDNIKSHGWDGGSEAVISCGNHDNCGVTRDFNGMSKNYGIKFFEDSKIALHVFDGNSNFGTGSTQYNTMKGDMESSDAWYNFAVIHQPFATAKSNHGPNGQFNTYQPIFKDNGVQLVLQAHNHNSQRFNISGVNYVLDGAGWHDTGSSLYSINSDAFNQNPLLFSDDSHNGFLLLDVRIDNPDIKEIKGTWMRDNESVHDTFTIKSGTGGGTTPPPEPPGPGENQPPQIELTDDVTASVGDTIRLNATVTDPDGAVESVDWSQVGGTFVGFNSNENGLTFTPDVGDNYTFAIKATDDKGASTTRTAVVTVTGGPPPPPPPECPVGTAWNPITQQCEPIPPPPPPTEICGNGIDDDGDGLIDEGCPVIPPPPPPPVPGVPTGFNMTVGAGIVKFVPNDNTSQVFETEITNGTISLPVEEFFNITIASGDVKFIPTNKSLPIFETQVENGTVILPKP